MPKTTKTAGSTSRTRSGRGAGSAKSKSGAEKNPTNPNSNRFAVILRDVALLGWALICLVVLVALWTYSPLDGGWSTSATNSELDNWLGPVGAFLSDLLFSIFGYMSYLLPVLLAYRVWWIVREHRSVEGGVDWVLVAVRTGGIALLMLAGAAVFSLNGQTDYLPQDSGGILGSVVASFSVSALGLFGANLVLVALFLLGITIYTGLSWLILFEKVGRWTLNFGSNISHWIARWKNSRADKQKTEMVVKERKASLKQANERRAQRTPPVIQTKPVKKELSARAQKEKQSSLFNDDEVVGSFPSLTLLDSENKTTGKGYSEETLEGLSRMLELKLKDFGIVAEVVSVHPGPVVTRFEIQPAPGVKASRITGLAKDLARSLAVISVRVVEVIPGKSVVGIEIPNENREIVRLSEVLSSKEYDNSRSPLSMALGHDISGQPIIADLAKMPHLLVAGTTGSGKSVGVNVMLVSLLYKSTPKEVRLILVDPKMLELSVYEGIPHLLTPVITDMKDAANGLRWCVGEMERRYKLMAHLGVRNLVGFNRKINEAIQSGEPLLDPFWVQDELYEGPEEGPPELEPLPAIVVVIDEFADMMMIVGKKVEQLIARIAQKARAAGIHLILATQRPSVDVITGLIKANIPTRIGFQVSSRIDSRTILDQGGAEQLLGHGDMLYLPSGTSVPTRVHGAFVDDHEVHKVVSDWQKRGEPDYINEITDESSTSSIPVPGFTTEESGSDGETDALYDEAVAFVTESRKASISAVQRKLRIGYNRAARIIETMEAAGVVTEMQSNGNREVIAPAPRKS